MEGSPCKKKAGNRQYMVHRRKLRSIGTMEKRALIGAREKGVMRKRSGRSGAIEEMLKRRRGEGRGRGGRGSQEQQKDNEVSRCRRMDGEGIRGSDEKTPKKQGIGERISRS